MEVPEDEALRGIEDMRIQDLRTLAASRGVEPEVTGLSRKLGAGRSASWPLWDRRPSTGFLHRVM
jgi:hypothetical protein